MRRKPGCGGCRNRARRPGSGRLFRARPAKFLFPEAFVFGIRFLSLLSFSIHRPFSSFIFSSNFILFRGGVRFCRFSGAGQWKERFAQQPQDGETRFQRVKQRKERFALSPDSSILPFFFGGDESNGTGCKDKKALGLCQEGFRAGREIRFGEKKIPGKKRGRAKFDAI